MTDHLEASSTNDLVAARLVRRMVAQWPLIVACALVAGIAGYFVAHRKPDVYQAKTTVQLNDIDLGSVFLSQNLQQQGQDAPTKAATAAKLASMPAVMQEASRSLGGAVSANRLGSLVAVIPQSDTTLIDITAQAGSAKFAAQQANAVRSAFIKIRQETVAAQLIAARTRIGEQIKKLPANQLNSAVGFNLTSRYNQLDTLIATQGAGVTTAQVATAPAHPIAPRPKRSAIMALLLGGILGLGIAFVRARLDDRIRDERELAEHWDLPVLGLIPQTGDLVDAGRTMPSAAAVEAFALARTNMRYLHVGGEVRRLVITSAMSGEGKSTVAWNLSLAAAMAGQRVLLIDADLRRPVLAQRLGLTTQRGLSDLLAGLAEPADAISPVHVSVGGSDEAVVDVVGAGFVPPSPIALLERPSSGELLKRLSESYDLVIIDTPPATVVADAKVLMSHADGVIVVSRLGRVTGSVLDRLRGILSGLDTPVIGTVVNSGATAKSYGYSSYTSEAPTTGGATPPSSPTINKKTDSSKAREKSAAGVSA